MPKGPVRILVGFSAGGSADVVGRLISEKFRERTRLTTIVENKPGVSGVIATEAVVKAAADGNTMVLAAMASTIMAKLTFTKLPYDPQKDLAPVTLVSTFQLVLAVTPSLPITDMNQFAVWAKANPDKANFGVPAVGGHSHFFGLMLGKTLGVDMQVVPYKGSAPMITDLSSGQLLVGVSALSDFLASHKAGKVRIIATSGQERSLSAPDLPTFTASGFPTLAGDGWLALYAPAHTPPATVAALSAEMAAVLKLPDVRERIVLLGMDPRGSTPAGLAEFDEGELKRWQPIVAASGFKVE
ncbi:Bug family tripartite tricarboxylate transporter substrate binding protein [Reyranella sp.]|uniref:Bug family tripartite tricarboxylate transporter substrate binding protein n=1 Tax=Reyranella sp. TaxID=1929291 RepID=UPI0027320F18|nr:Bug family tripartite tricarboxylate transporter substrate binding protein [Reyranella sp.]MDP2378768.1 Bug family tripartite tricarboxylate transporter substrate binding protein [Reyranella sp.]